MFHNLSLDPDSTRIGLQFNATLGVGVWQLVLSVGTEKFDRGLTQLRHSELHWPDVPERMEYKLGVTVHQCLQSRAPQYLVDCCTPTSDVASRQRLRCVNRYQLIVPRHCLSKFSRRTFSVVGPMTWNPLFDNLHLVMTSSKQQCKQTFSPCIRMCSALGASCVIALYKCTITYLLLSVKGHCLCLFQTRVSVFLSLPRLCLSSLSLVDPETSHYTACFVASLLRCVIQTNKRI